MQAVVIGEESLTLDVGSEYGSNKLIRCCCSPSDGAYRARRSPAGASCSIKLGLKAEALGWSDGGLDSEAVKISSTLDRKTTGGRESCFRSTWCGLRADLPLVSTIGKLMIDKEVGAFQLLLITRAPTRMLVGPVVAWNAAAEARAAKPTRSRKYWYTQHFPKPRKLFGAHRSNG